MPLLPEEQMINIWKHSKSKAFSDINNNVQTKQKLHIKAILNVQ